MTEAFTAGVMIFIEQLQARWPWSIGLLESWLSMSSSSEVPASSILMILSPSMFRPRLWDTSSGVFAVGVFTAEARREQWARPSRLRLIYVVHAYCCYMIGQHSDYWNLIDRFQYRCSFWSEVLLCTFLMPDTKIYVFLSFLPSC